MTIHDLIEALSGMPPDAMVTVQLMAQYDPLRFKALEVYDAVLEVDENIVIIRPQWHRSAKSWE